MDFCSEGFLFYKDTLDDNFSFIFDRFFRYENFDEFVGFVSDFCWLLLQFHALSSLTWDVFKAGKNALIYDKCQRKRLF